MHCSTLLLCSLQTVSAKELTALQSTDPPDRFLSTSQIRMDVEVGLSCFKHRFPMKITLMRVLWESPFAINRCCCSSSKVVLLPVPLFALELEDWIRD